MAGRYRENERGYAEFDYITFKYQPMVTRISLSRLMKMSWEIQRNKRSNRSKALTAAWTILSNEDVAVYYLTAKLNRNRPLAPKALNQISLFNPLNRKP
jgi:hypothetical protein